MVLQLQGAVDNTHTYSRCVNGVQATLAVYAAYGTTGRGSMTRLHSLPPVGLMAEWLKSLESARGEAKFRAHLNRRGNLKSAACMLKQFQAPGARQH